MLIDPNTLLQEIGRARASLGKSTTFDAKKELEKNIYPLLAMTVQSLTAIDIEVAQRVALAEQVMADYLTEQESMLLPELATELVGTITIGLEVCKAVAALDHELPGELQGLIAAYGASAKSSLLAIGEVVIETPDDAPDEEEDVFTHAAKTSIKPDTAIKPNATTEVK